MPLARATASAICEPRSPVSPSNSVVPCARPAVEPRIEATLSAPGRLASIPRIMRVRWLAPVSEEATSDSAVSTEGTVVDSADRK